MRDLGVEAKTTHRGTETMALNLQICLHLFVIIVQIVRP